MVEEAELTTDNGSARRGGARPRAGRRLSHWGRLVRRNARVNQAMIDYCELRGNGDFSEGVRIAIAESMAAYAKTASND
jgi:hypothetical protein